jgi:hypothetical protein
MPMDFYLWLRQLAGQKMIDMHRRHPLQTAQTFR